MSAANVKSRSNESKPAGNVLPLDDVSAVNPDAVHDAETEHDHAHEGAAVADKRQRNAGDRQQRNGHPDVLEDVGENQRRKSYYQKQSELIAGEESYEEA